MTLNFGWGVITGLIVVCIIEIVKHCLRGV